MAVELATCTDCTLPDEAAVAVVGAGAMGSGIAQVAVLAGHPVALHDSRPGAAPAAIEAIGAQLQRLVAKGKLDAQACARARMRLRAVAALDALAGSALVVEAIVEQLEAKCALFQALEDVLDPSAILATNSSSIPVTAIGAVLRRPERLAGMHFFNPAPLMALVEVVSGARTAPALAELLCAVARRWGKVPVRARATPGFIVNRVARPFYAEGLRLLEEGAADCATLDAVLREAGGFRMGPFELMDLIGHDVNYAVTRSVFDAHYGDPRFTPSLRQLELVQAGFLGRKCGRGFYLHGENAPPRQPVSVAPQQLPAPLRLYHDSGLGELLMQRLKLAGIAVECRPAHTDGRLAEAGRAVLYRCDGRTATARAAHGGVADTVLVDLALDDTRARRLAIAGADQADPAALRAATGLLQAAGYAVSVLDDVPGLAVARTVAMLANEAADAVNQGVCSAGDVDLAMRHGVNYPRGPLEWAQALGIGRVVGILEQLAAAYGEDRYRVSPLLRRKALSGQAFTAGKSST